MGRNRECWVSWIMGEGSRWVGEDDRSDGECNVGGEVDNVG